MASNTYTGQCYCGAVRYEVTGKPEAVYFCHCEQCRQITGSAHASNMQTKPENIKWLQGQGKITKFSCPTERHFNNAFCSECGSGVPFCNKSEDWMFVPIGGLKDLPDDIIEANIFWGDRATWYEKGCLAKRLAKFS